MSLRKGSPMETQCNAAYLDFPMLGRREIVADFDGGDITSDGGALLLRKTEQLTAIIRQFAACFTDHRDPDLIEHTVEVAIHQCRSGLGTAICRRTGTLANGRPSVLSIAVPGFHPRRAG
jgi:hypothetical protein